MLRHNRIPIACRLHSSFYGVLINMDENTVIKKVMDNQFSVRLLHNELTTVENERPAAPLPSLMAVHITKSNAQNIFASLCIKRWNGWQNVKQRNLLLFLSCFCFKETRNMEQNRACRIL